MVDKETRFTMMLHAVFSIMVGYLIANAEMSIPRMIIPAYILGALTILYPLINIWVDNDK